MFTSEPLTIPIAWMMGADVTGAFSQFTSVSHWMIILAGPLGFYALTQLLIVCWGRLIRSKLNWRKLRSRYIRGAIAGLPLLPLAMLIALADAPHSSLVVSSGWLLLPLVIALGVEAALVRCHGSPGSDREGR